METSEYTKEIRGLIKEIEIEYTGELAATDTGLLTIAAIKGLLAPVLGSSVNFVNASDLAKKRNINVKETKSNVQGYYSTLIKLHLKTEKNEHRVYGTLFDGKTAKIVDIDTYRVDFVPEGNLILAPHIDKPNMIGQIATLLGKANININGMQVGSTPKADTNIMAIAVGKEIDKDILQQIRKISGILDVKMIKCEE